MLFHMGKFSALFGAGLDLVFFELGNCTPHEIPSRTLHCPDLRVPDCLREVQSPKWWRPCALLGLGLKARRCTPLGCRSPAVIHPFHTLCLPGSFDPYGENLLSDLNGVVKATDLSLANLESRISNLKSQIISILGCGHVFLLVKGRMKQTQCCFNDIRLICFY